MAGVFGAYADDKGLYFPGTPFVLSAGIMTLSVVILAATMRRHAR